MPELESVEVNLTADPMQARLVVELAVRNSGQHVVRLNNPFEMAQLLVVDHNGFPKRVPVTAPSLLINTKGRTAWKLETAVPIVAVKHNRQEVGQESLDVPVLELKPGDGYAAEFLIERFLPDPEEATPGIEPVDEQVAPGEYRVRALVTLIDADDPKRSRTAQTPSVTLHLAAI